MRREGGGGRYGKLRSLRDNILTNLRLVEHNVHELVKALRARKMWRAA